MNNDDIPPVPKSADNPNDALIFLAGAVDAALTIKLSSSGNEKVTDEWLILQVAFKQYTDSGFFTEETKNTRNSILEAFHYIIV